MFTERVTGSDDISAKEKSGNVTAEKRMTKYLLTIESLKSQP